TPPRHAGRPCTSRFTGRGAAVTINLHSHLMSAAVPGHLEGRLRAGRGAGGNGHLTLCAPVVFSTTSAQRAEHVHAEIEDGPLEDHEGVRQGADPPGWGDPIHAGHTDAHQNHLRTMAPANVTASAPLAASPATTRSSAEDKIPQPGADQRVVPSPP